jgi:amidase
MVIVSLKPKNLANIQPKPFDEAGGRNYRQVSTKEIILMTWTATALSEKYRDGDCSPVIIVEDYLQQINRLNPHLHALNAVFAESAISAAHEAEAALETGDPTGPLLGIPIAIKDLATTREGQSSAGTNFLGDHLAVKDCELVERLRQEGAIIIGKTAMTEGAFSMHHPSVNAPVSPWSPAHWTGVSSSGSGVAVAAGLCPLALGSDTGGSIRLPSACNHLVGLKPTYGAVSDQGTVPLAASLDHLGPMGRSVDDCALMFDAMSGTKTDDGAGAGRIGVDLALLESSCSNPVFNLMRAVIEEYGQLGFEIVDISLPQEQRELAAGWIATTANEAAAFHAPYQAAHGNEYGPAFRFLLDFANQVDDRVLRSLEATRGIFANGLDTILSELDALLCPVMPDLDEMASRQPSPEAIAQSLLYTAPFNYSGHPALTLPAGFIDGVPSGYQLIGTRGGEANLLAIARSHESLKRWWEDEPDLSWIDQE